MVSQTWLPMTEHPLISVYDGSLDTEYTLESCGGCASMGEGELRRFRRLGVG